MPDHDTPCEMGKRAYKEGVRLADNPFLAHPLKAANAQKAWAEGWLYQRAHDPSAKDAAMDAIEDDADRDCLSPWRGDESGYGGYW